MTESNLPLAGLRVLDIATFVAAPFAAATLSEFGAEVIKIEQPGEGDSLRRLGTQSKAGDTYWWLSDARNKKCITLDLRTPKGVEVFQKLVATADVVAENFRPGTLEKWGIGPEVLQAINPKLIVLRISAYGQTGPKANLPGFARIAHAFCGLTHLVGEADGPPLIPGSTSLGDYLTGIYGAFGVMLALRSREKTGKGQVVDLGLYEPMFRFLDELAPTYGATGLVRNRAGAEAPGAAPHSHYPTRDDKWVAIACSNDRMFQRLVEVMGKPELAQRPEYATGFERIKHRETLNALVSAWSGGLTQAEVLDLCSAGEVPCGPVNDIADIFADEQFATRENLLTLEHPIAGKITIPNVLPRLSNTPGRINHLGAALGEHNQQVYSELGLSSEEQEQLAKEKVI